MWGILVIWLLVCLFVSVRKTSRANEKIAHLEREVKSADNHAEAYREALEKALNAYFAATSDGASQKPKSDKTANPPPPHRSPSGKAHWTKILGLSFTAEEEEIRARYRAMAKRMHANNEPEIMFKTLNVARDEAIASVKRRAY